MTQYTLPEVHLLNSSGLLKYLLNQPLLNAVDPDQVKYWTFLSYHKANRFQPDHIANAKWRGLCGYKEKHRLNLGPLLALKRLADEYFEDHPQCRVKLSCFGYWQSLMTRVSSLPVQAAHYTHSKFSSVPMYRWPVYPWHPYVEDYISREQLHETHQHLNGSSTAETCWLETLQKPKAASAEFHKAFNSQPKLRQLCAQIDPDLTPVTLLQRLQLAECIRSLLGRFVCDQSLIDEDDTKQYYDAYARADKPVDLLEVMLQEGSLYVDWPTSEPYSLDADFHLMRELFKKLQLSEYKNSPYERLLWIYLLIQNQYLTLLVQRDDFYGFDQFQKYASTELRDLSEKTYLQRFEQAHGNEPRSQTGYLEGRFAPKKDAIKMERLLASILDGYGRYLGLEGKEPRPLSKALDALDKTPNNPEKARLALVGHFIKRPAESAEKFPYEKLYKDTTNQAGILINLLQKQPLLSKWLTGIDAAANEMDTPPEVFAPLFRVLKAQGIKHATFHVGEDFPHLISGIRAVDDALRFLPLSNGDRLGHCTAIGIAPNIWKRSLPPTLELDQETRLLDLIFIWRELGSNSQMLHWANKAASGSCSISSNYF